jgi:hypothetical protein
MSGDLNPVCEFDIRKKAFIAATDNAIDQSRKLHGEKFCMEQTSGLYY